MARLENREFFDAVEQNDMGTVKRFVNENNVFLTTLDSTNQTALHIAAGFDNLNMVKFFLEKDRSLLDIRDCYEYNVLHRAIEKGSINIVKCLIEEYKADVSATVHPVYGNTVLHIAAAAGQLQVFKYLIEERNMDVNLRNLYGQPAAFSAAAHKRIDIIKYLAEERKEDLRTLDSKNENILFVSMIRRDMRIPRYLLDDRKLNFDINWRGYAGRTLAYLAARIRATNFIKYLVEEKEADVNIADNDGVTPLHRAAQYNNVKVVKFLVKFKANVRATDKDGKTPIDLADDPQTINYLQMVMKRRGRWKRHAETFSNSTDDGIHLRDFFRKRFIYSDESFYCRTFIPTVNQRSLVTQNAGSTSMDPIDTGRVNPLQSSLNFISLLDLLVQYLRGLGKKKHASIRPIGETSQLTYLESEKYIPLAK